MAQTVSRTLIAISTIQAQAYDTLVAPLPPIAEAGEQALADRMIGAARR